MTVTDAPATAQPCEVPQDLNSSGATVARSTVSVPADQVQVGDLIVEGSYVNRVTEVRALGPAPRHGSDLIFLAGTYNRCRFAHEQVTIVRADR